MDQETRQKLIALFEEKLSRAMRLYLDTCTRCGVCIEACHVYASTGEIRYIAASRHELIRKLYKRYFTMKGRLIPSYEELIPFDDNAIHALNEAAYSCTGCRRCMVYCPFGIDTQMIMGLAKLLLIGADAAPEILTLLADTSIEKGKSFDLYKESYLTGIKRLEEDVIRGWQLEAGRTPIPTDVEGADMLYVALAGAHSIIPAATIFNAASERWTLSFFEAVNFGAFVGDPVRTKLIMDRIIHEANRLKVKEVCICECGTAYRIAKQLTKGQPFRVLSITEVHARYIREKRIRLKQSDTPITYHDPCQIARNGGVIEEPRYILRHLTKDFRDMSEDVRYNWCCGGGGGLVAMGEDTLNFRMRSSQVKVDQVKEKNVSILATACENCHTQLQNLNDHYKMDVSVQFLSTMVKNALH